MPCNERPAGQEEAPRSQQHPSQVCQQPDPSVELDPGKCGTACWSLGQSRRPVQEHPKSHMGKEPREKIPGPVAESSAPYVPSPHGECSPGPSSVGLQSGPTVSFPGPASRPDPPLSGSGSVVNSPVQGPQPLLDLQALPVNSITLG